MDELDDVPSPEEFRVAHLPRTVENALGFFPYRETFPSVLGSTAPEGVDRALFERLPTISREEFREQQERNLPLLRGRLAFVTHTGGTTGGKMNFRYRSAEDVDAMTELLRDTPDEDSEGDARVVLYVQRPTHGTDYQDPNGNLKLIGSVMPGREIEQTVELLNKRFTVPGYRDRVSLVGGQFGGVLALTDHLWASGIDPRTYGIEVVSTFGQYISPTWRSYLERSWGVPVSDTLAMSELNGMAAQCLNCRRYHYDLFVYPEYLHPLTREPVEDGLAMLVQTELAPFVTFSPLVRYWTGDLVQVERTSCGGERLSMVPRGRWVASLTDPDVGGRGVVLTGGDLRDVVDECPEVTGSDPSHVAWAMASRSHARAAATIERAGRAPRVVVELQCAYSVTLYPASARALEERVRARLLEHSAELAHAVGAGYELDVRAVNRDLPPLKA